MKTKLKKPVLSLEDRFRALDFLAAGKTVKQLVNLLLSKHPGFSKEGVKAAYFPLAGPFCIFRYQEGIGQQQVTAVKKEIIARSEKWRRAHREVLSRPEIREKARRAASARLKRLHQDPEFAAKRDQRGREHFLRLFSDPGFVAAHKERCRQRMVEQNLDPKFRRASSKSLKRLNQDPEFAARRDKASSERMRRLRKDPAFMAKSREALRLKLQDPLYKKQLSKAMKARHRDPQFRAKLIAADSQNLKRLWQRPDFAENCRQRIKALWQNPRYRAKKIALAREQMIAFRQNPEFEAKRLAGLARYWNTYRLKFRQAMADYGIEVREKDQGGKTLILGRSFWSAERIVMSHERRQVVADALMSLLPLERTVIELAYFASRKGVATAEDIAAVMAKTTAEISAALKSALCKLAQNRQLRELL